MSLRSFLSELEEKEDVIHVTDEVSTRFEVSAIIKAFDGCASLHFENVINHDMEIISNISGTRERLCLALNVDLDLLHKRLSNAWQSPTKPRIVKDGFVKEIVEKPRLSEIPALTHFGNDAWPYITSAVISARTPDEEIENVSIHRLMVLDDNHLAIRLVPRHLYKLWSIAKEEKRDLDVAVSLGVHPAILLAAASSISFGMSEFDVANSLLRDKLQLIECEKVNAYGPAESEIILEGRISTEKETLEGPFVDITGTYDIQRSQPVIEIVNVMRRRDCLYPAILPSGIEHKLLMGLPREVMIWESVNKVVPFVKAVNLSIGGCGWLHAAVSIEKPTEGAGKNALLAAFSAHNSLKHAIVVDTDIDVYDSTEVEWALATRFQGGEDLVVINNVRGSSLDPSSDQIHGLTTKLGFDATRSLKKSTNSFKRAKIPTNEKVKKIINKDYMSI